MHNLSGKQTSNYSLTWVTPSLNGNLVLRVWMNHDWNQLLESYYHLHRPRCFQRTARLIKGLSLIYNLLSHQQPHLHAYKQVHQYLTDKEVVSCIAPRGKELRSLSCSDEEMEKINCFQMGEIMQNDNDFTSWQHQPGSLSLFFCMCKSQPAQVQRSCNCGWFRSGF